MDFCAHWGHYNASIFLTAQLFATLYEWYNLWEELWQLLPNGQQHTQLNTYGQLIQTSPSYDEYVSEIRQ